MTYEESLQKFHTDDASLTDLGSASDWLKKIFLAPRPIRSTTQIWVVYVISMEFRRSFNKSQNVGCFVKLET